MGMGMGMGMQPGMGMGMQPGMGMGMQPGMGMPYGQPMHGFPRGYVLSGGAVLLHRCLAPGKHRGASLCRWLPRALTSPAPRLPHIHPAAVACFPDLACRLT